MSRRWLIGLLVASVVVNLALAGYVVGKLASPVVRSPALLMQSSSDVPRMLKTLPETRRQELLNSTDHHHQPMHKRYREIRKAQRAVLDATLSDPFDEENYRVSQQNLNELFLTMKQHHDQFLSELLAQMTFEEREQVIRSLIERPRTSRAKGDRDSSKREEAK